MENVDDSSHQKQLKLFQSSQRSLHFGFGVIRDSQIDESGQYEMRVDDSRLCTELLMSVTESQDQPSQTSQEFDRWVSGQLAPVKLPLMSSDQTSETVQTSDGRREMSEVSIFAKKSEACTPAFQKRKSKQFTVTDLSEVKSGSKGSDSNGNVSLTSSIAEQRAQNPFLVDKCSEQDSQVMAAQRTTQSTEHPSEASGLSYAGALKSLPSIDQSVPAHERLLAKGEEYFLRQVQRSKIQTQEEMKACTFRPRLTSTRMHMSNNKSQSSFASFVESRQRKHSKENSRCVSNNKQSNASFDAVMSKPRDFQQHISVRRSLIRSKSKEIADASNGFKNSSSILRHKVITAVITAFVDLRLVSSAEADLLNLYLGPETLLRLLTHMGFISDQPSMQEQQLVTLMLETLSTEDTQQIIARSVIIFILAIYGLSFNGAAINDEQDLTQDEISLIQVNFRVFKINRSNHERILKAKTEKLQSTAKKSQQPVSRQPTPNGKLRTLASETLSTSMHKLPPKSSTTSYSDLRSIHQTSAHGKLFDRHKGAESKPSTLPSKSIASKHASTSSSFIKVEVKVNDYKSATLLVNPKHPQHAYRQIEELATKHNMLAHQQRKIRELVDRTLSSN